MASTYREDDANLSTCSSIKEKISMLKSEESSLDKEVNPLPKRKRSQSRVWTFIQKFDNLVTAENYIKNEKIWSFFKTNKVEEGIKKYFRCNKVKRKGPQCSAQLYILIDSFSDDVILFRTESDHDHDSKILSVYGLSDEVKQEINKLHDLHMKPKSILKNLAKVDGITVPKMSQLRTYLVDRRRAKYGQPTISLGETKARLTSHSSSTGCKENANISTCSSIIMEKMPMLESEESSLDEEVNLLPKRKRSQSKVWTFIQKFDNLESAENYIKNEKIWSFLKKYEVEEGLKKYFRCNKVKRKGPQCSAQLYIFIDSSSDEVILFRTESDHDHDSKMFSGYGLSDEVKQEINKLHNLHMKPKSILDNLAKLDGITVPKLSQLRTYLVDRRRAKYGQPTISLGEMKALLTSNSSSTSREDNANISTCSSVMEKMPMLESEESSSDEEVNLLPKRKRSKSKVWTLIQKFDNLENAENYIKTEKTWSFLKKYEVEEGLKKYFRCNKVKRKGPQCSAQLYIFIDSSSDEVILFRTESDHDHNSKMLSRYGLSDKVKKEINKLHNLHMKPKSILENLAKLDGITVPKMSQLRTYLVDRRITKYGQPTISLGETEAWLTSHLSFTRRKDNTNISTCSSVMEKMPMLESEESSLDEEVNLLPKRKRSKSKVWTFIQKFDNLENAENYIKNEKTWSFLKEYEVEEGLKKYFRCNKVKCKGPQCSAQLYIFIDLSTDEVILFRSESDHNHDSKMLLGYGLSDKVKQEINKLHNLHMKPKYILENLANVDGITVPKMSPLRTYLDDSRRAKYGQPTINLGELEAWLTSHSLVPDDEHEMYVIGHSIFSTNGR